jgi:transcriptional regulator with XRE-family HTH domain
MATLTVVDPVEFGRRVRRDRLRLGLTQQEAAERSGGLVSYSQWRVIEKGTRAQYRLLTLRGVEKSLGWDDGDADASDTDKVAELEREVAELRRRLEAIEADREPQRRVAREG